MAEVELSLLGQVAVYKSQGKTVQEIAVLLDQPVWLISVLYSLC